MIDTIVFDMGQVLIHWKPELLIAYLGLTKEEARILLTELFQSVEWVQLDRGTITGEQAAERVCRRLPEKLHPAVHTIVSGWWQRPLVPMEGMAELVRELKGNGYRIFLLSNASVDLRKYFHRIPGSECFDGLLVSGEEKLIKPQPEIFETLYRRFGLNPGDCFFVDDSPANVEAAQCTGMAGTVFRGDVNRLRRELQTAGIRCAETTGEKAISADT